MLLNSEISCIFVSLKKKLTFLVRLQKSYKPVNIWKTAYSSQGCVKKGFWVNFRRKKTDYFAISSTFVRLETKISLDDNTQSFPIIIKGFF